MGSESLARNHFQVVVRATIRLYVRKIKKKIKQYIQYSIYGGSRGTFKAVVGFKKSSPLSISGGSEG